MILQLWLAAVVIVLMIYALCCIYHIKKIKQKNKTLENSFQQEQEKKQLLKEELNTLQQKIAQDLLADPLTGLSGRKIFEDHLTLTINQSLRHQLTFSVMFLDLDRFHIINDTFGYEHGDHLLKEVAERLSSCVRQVDTVSRLGGDKFVFIFSQIAKAETAAYIAQRLLDAIAEPFVIQGQELYVTASIGITIFPHDGNDEETLMKYADIALHQAKLQGRNSYQFFREEMHTLSKRELLLSSCLRNETVFQNFVVYYQPRVDVATKKVVSMEAILQWNHPEFGRVTFEEIFCLAEKNNSISIINEWLLRTASQDLLKWHAHDFNPQSISIPIPLKQLENAHFIQTISNILQETHLTASSLIFEITEPSLLTKIEVIEKMLHMLKRLGIQIAINNFGASHLPLQQLRRLPIDIFKMDRSIIFDITSNKESEAIIKMIIALANSFEASVVAEGVENAAQKNTLTALGCTIMQGTVFSQPALADEFSAETILL